MTTAPNMIGIVQKPVVYLNDPMNKPQETEEDLTNPAPQDSSENESPTEGSGNEQTDWKKRYSDLRKRDAALESTIAELKTQVNELKLTKSQEPAVQMPKTPEEWEAFETKYPELAAQIKTGAAMVFKSSSSVIADKLKQLEEIQNSIRSREGVIELKKYHPDFEEIKDNPRFHAWFIEQTQEIQGLIQSSNPRTIAKGLDMFKVETGIGKTVSQKAEAKRDATREVKTPSRVQLGEGQKRTYTEREINRMPMHEFEKHKEDIIAAQWEGRISKG